MKVCGSTVKLQLILATLSAVEEGGIRGVAVEALSAAEAGGIRGVAVKCLDITKNSDCEGSLLERN